MKPGKTVRKQKEGRMNNLSTVNARLTDSGRNKKERFLIFFISNLQFFCRGDQKTNIGVISKQTNTSKNHFINLIHDSQF